MEIPHVVILPFPAQGHIKPMFILAKLLSHAGLNITFINTHHNHNLILKLIDGTSSRNSFPKIRFMSIPDGLPVEDPRTYPSIKYLLHSTTLVCKPHFKELMVKLSEENGEWMAPSCIIGDGIMSFAIDVAQELGIKAIAFRTFNATCTWVYFHLQKLIENGKIPIQGM